MMPAWEGDAMLLLDKRIRIIDEEVRRYVELGYRVVYRTPMTAQLVKLKKFDCLWALIGFMAFFVGLLVYLIYYVVTQPDTALYLEVDQGGKVIASFS
jgi:hypothetical protein